eukprot:7130066-Prymnesium_polylepis.1
MHIRGRQPQPLITRAYYDGAGEPPRLPAVDWFALDVVQPWANAFVNQQRLANSSVQRAYWRRQFTCVAPSRDLATCADVFTVYKVVAIYDAVQARAASYVIWVDLDAFLRRPPRVGSNQETARKQRRCVLTTESCGVVIDLATG